MQPYHRRAFFVFIAGLLLALTFVRARPVQAAGIVSTCTEADFLIALNAGGTVNFACSGTIVLTNTITITTTTTINGSGYAVVLSGGNARQIFILNGGTLTLNNLTISNGYASGNGGAISVSTGSLVINNSTFTNNVSGMFGGAMIIGYNAAGVIITNSTFQGNTAKYGGAIYASGIPFSVTNSTFSGNNAPNGAIIYLDGCSPSTIINSTFSGNIASTSSLGIVTTNAINTTLRNSILANNTGQNCAGTSSASVVGSNNISFPSSSGCPSVLVANPLLSPLGDYGGATQTFALQAGSPAINRAASYCPTADQRGKPRPTGTCDAGSYEITATSTALASSTSPSSYKQSVTFTAAVISAAGTPTGTVTFKDGENVLGTASLDGSGVATLTTTALSAGSHTITASYTSSANLDPSSATLPSGQTVNPVMLTVTADNKSKTYGTANPALTYTVTGFVGGEDESILSGAPSLSTTANAASLNGSYPITILQGTLLANSNYTLAFVNGTLTVADAVLTITADDKSKAYGGDNPTLTYTAAGFIPGDDESILTGAPELSTVAVKGSPAGSYDINVARGTLAATRGSYTIVFEKGTLKVTRVELTVTAQDQSRSYGAAGPTFTYTASGFVNGETAAVLSGSPAYASASQTSPVNSYDITITQGSLDSVNYTFKFVNGTLTVTPANLTIKADDKEKPAGTANPALTYTIAGFMNGETANVLSGSPLLATGVTVSSPPGSYPITISQGSLSALNYSFTFMNGTLKVIYNLYFPIAFHN